MSVGRPPPHGHRTCRKSGSKGSTIVGRRPSEMSRQKELSSRRGPAHRSLGRRWNRQ
jgi:hypothetical protein